MKSSLLERLSTYAKDINGQFSVITALMGLPLLGMAGYAIDYNNAHRSEDHIASALDSAALAAVLPANLSDDQREAYAQKVFDRNYAGNIEVKLDLAATRERVDLVADAKVPTLMGGIISMDTMSVKVASAAVLTKSDVVCVLALDPTGDGAIEFLDSAQFSAPACSVQSNSAHQHSIRADSYYAPSAQSFCSVGTSTGSFKPFIKHACTPIIDPYENLPVPNPGPCMDINKIKGTAKNINDDTVALNNAVLYPGTYCNGLEISGTNVRFMPGTYLFQDKALTFKRQSTAVGDGVTFVLSGKKSGLKVEGNSQVTLTAPKTGAYAGVAFYQPTLPTKPGKKPKLPVGKNVIKTGGGLTINGTAYFPRSELRISSNNSVQSIAPATSFIAYRLRFSGESNIEVRVDHEKSGIPPLLPRSDEGARLVK